MTSHLWTDPGAVHKRILKFMFSFLSSLLLSLLIRIGFIFLFTLFFMCLGFFLYFISFFKFSFLLFLYLFYFPFAMLVYYSLGFCFWYLLNREWISINFIWFEDFLFPFFYLAPQNFFLVRGIPQCNDRRMSRQGRNFKGRASKHIWGWSFDRLARTHFVFIFQGPMRTHVPEKTHDFFYNNAWRVEVLKDRNLTIFSTNMRS